MLEFIGITSILLIHIEALASLVPERVWGEMFVRETTASKVGAAGALVSNMIVVVIGVLSLPAASREVTEILLVPSVRL
ncbi:hypothetical protein ES705_44753 [subsurface metagenome]